MRCCYTLLALLVFSGLWAQEELAKKEVDSLFREDQFYCNVSINNIQHPPSGLRQQKISPYFAFGILRDMPINKNRTYAIAAGVGYAVSVLNNNLQVTQTPDASFNYSMVGNTVHYSKNKTTLHYIEFPIELRWRNATFESHKFWRIYTGFKISYLLSSKYVFESDENNYSLKNDNNLNKMQYGCYIASGYNSLNVYFYYGLNPIFKSSYVDGQHNTMNNFNLGVQFYIL